MNQNKDMAQLDLLIDKIGGNSADARSEGPCGLLLEHLRAARRDLLGSMPGEYRLSLLQAKVSISCISEKGRRAEVKESLQNLIGSGK